MTDNQTLIAQYARNGSESAFRELVARYIDFVHSTAVRLVGGDCHLAQDVTQTVFIHLARNAHRLSGNVMLGGWLHRDTCNVAANVIRGQRRRQAREKQAAEMNALQDHSESNLAQIAPVLDHAINHLDSEDRTAIFLRFFEQKDFRAVGQALGKSEDAAKKRVGRALDKLHHLLTARGVTLSIAALATALLAGAVKAAPAGLLESVMGTAIASSAVGSGAGLTFIKLMTTSKIGFGVASAVLVAGAVFAAKHHLIETNLLDANGSLRQQNQHVAAEAQQLSNQLAQVAGVQAASEDQLRELIRLRGEVGLLRRQLADAAKARERNGLAQQAQAGVDSQEEQKQKAERRARDAKILGFTFRSYAFDHQDQFPTNIGLAVPYIVDPFRADLNPGEVLRDEADFMAQVTNRFEVVYNGSVTNQADGEKILIREKQPSQASDGTWIKAYGFVDGSGQLHSESDGNFDNWEKQHMVSSDSGK